jgi:hypothetical protein
MSKQQTQDELYKKYKELINLLEVSIEAYDRWTRESAIMMATNARVLLHDTKNSISLYNLLDIKNKMYYNTALVQWNATTWHSLLTQMFLGDKWAMEVPLLDSNTNCNSVSFDLWWNNTIIEDLNWNKFSRKDIILLISNKDGWAHVGEKIPQGYYELSRKNSLWKMVDNNWKWEPVSDSHYVTMRQIAHEIIKTEKPDYFSEWELKWLNWYLIWGTLSFWFE